MKCLITLSHIYLTTDKPLVLIQLLIQFQSDREIGFKRLLLKQLNIAVLGMLERFDDFIFKVTLGTLSQPKGIIYVIISAIQSSVSLNMGAGRSTATKLTAVPNGQ